MLICSWGKCMSCFTSIHAPFSPKRKPHKNQNPPRITFNYYIETTLASCVYRHWNRHASRSTRKRNLRSKIWWFTEFCNSHYVSHFAAFFIVAWAKISVAESCVALVSTRRRSSVQHRGPQHHFRFQMGWFRCLIRGVNCRKGRRPARGGTAHELQSAEYDQLDRCGNDPSAGSPTETLLRLHLPLNDEV